MLINIPFLETFICAKTEQLLLVSNPSNIPEVTYQMLEKHMLNLSIRADKYVMISPQSIFIEKPREAKHIIVYRFLQLFFLLIVVLDRIGQ